MAWTRTGTVSLTNGSATVYGAGTTWASAKLARAGDIFKAPDGRDYEVASVQSNTQLTLTTGYLGATVSGQAYALIHTGLLPAELAVGVSEMTAKNVGAMSQLYDWETSTAATVPMTNPATGITAQVKPIAGLIADIGLMAPKANPSTSGTLTHSGDILLSGSGKLITGDFSNATIANRVMFQTSVVNGNTAISAIPNGTATGSSFKAYAGSNPTNQSLCSIDAVSTDIRVQSTVSGTGTYLPMTFYTGGSERMRIDTAGNVGIGDASPGVRLQLKAATNTPSLRIVQDNNSSYGHSFQADSSDSSFKLKKYTAGADVATILTVTGSNDVLVTSPALMGYGYGAGGTVTQATSRSTSVPINKPCGQITMFTAAGSATFQSFTVTNSLVKSGDVISLTQTNGSNIYILIPGAIVDGSFAIYFATTGGTAVDTLKINFSIRRGAIA